MFPFQFKLISKETLHIVEWLVSYQICSSTLGGSVMVSALVFGSSGSGSSPGWGHCVVFLGKTLHSHSACLHQGV